MQSRAALINSHMSCAPPCCTRQEAEERVFVEAITNQYESREALKYAGALLALPLLVGFCISRLVAQPLWSYAQTVRRDLQKRRKLLVLLLLGVAAGKVLQHRPAGCAAALSGVRPPGCACGAEDFLQKVEGAPCAASCTPAHVLAPALHPRCADEPRCLCAAGRAEGGGRA